MSVFCPTPNSVQNHNAAQEPYKNMEPPIIGLGDNWFFMTDIIMFVP